MMQRKRKVQWLVWVCLGVGATFRVALAAEPAVPALAPMAAEVKTTEKLTLKHVSAVVMLWWIDPKKQQVPAEVTATREPDRSGRGGRGGGGQGAFRLPEGVASVRAVGVRDLEVVGTARGITTLKKILAYLDKPQAQVRATVTMVELDSNDLRLIGIDFKTNNGPLTVNLTGQVSNGGNFTLGYVRNNFKAKLQSMLDTGRANLLLSQPLLCLNNFTSKSSTTLLTPTQMPVAEGEAPLPLWENSTCGLGLTPTINNDGTITIVVDLKFEREPLAAAPEVALSDGVKPEKPRTTQSVLTTANIRDGDTISIGGLSKGQRSLICFVTASVVAAPTTP